MSMVGGMQGYTTGGGNDRLHDRIERLERENAQAKALLANQKELILHLYKQIDEAKK